MNPSRLSVARAAGVGGALLLCLALAPLQAWAQA